MPRHTAAEQSAQRDDDRDDPEGAQVRDRTSSEDLTARLSG